MVAEADGLLKYQTGADAIAELKRDRTMRERGLEVIHFTWGNCSGNRIAWSAASSLRSSVLIACAGRPPDR